MKGSGAVNFDVSTDGTLAYVPRLDVPVAVADTRFGWLTRDGSAAENGKLFLRGP